MGIFTGFTGIDEIFRKTKRANAKKMCGRYEMMRFDTRDKKPKVWNVGALTLVLGVVLSALWISGGEERAAEMSIVVAVYLLAVIVLLIRAFFLQLRYNPYSYNTIIYMGFSLFLIVALLMQIYLTRQMIRYPVEYGSSAILGILLGSAKNYMILTFPFLFFFSAALCVSNVSLIRHEGFRGVNVLGIILSFLLIGGVVFIFFFDYAVSGSQREVMIHDLIANLFASVYLYFECMLLGVMVADAIAVRYEPEPDKDFIIILGCGIRKDGTPSPLLRGRIDRALAFAEKQKTLTGKDPVFITSGGQGPDEPISESEAMKRYLLEQGIPEERILEEDRSTDTMENMAFSKRIILQRVRPGKEAPRGYWPSLDDPETKIAFSTTNYHVFRSGLCARREKMRAVGMGAKTKWYFWPNAAVREFVGLLTAHKLKQGLVLGGMIVFYVVLTILAYR